MTVRHTATTTRITHDTTPGTLTVARDRTGRISRVDLRLGQHGSTLGGLADALGSALTLALHAGAPATLLLDHRLEAAPIPAPRHATTTGHRSPAPALHAALTHHLTTAPLPALPASR